MRTERIGESITIYWRDERQGRVALQNPAQLRTCLLYFGFRLHDDTLPLSAEGEDYAIRIEEDLYPCTMVLTRKPHGSVQNAAWHFAAERLARILVQEGELGVLFLDENRFVPFSHLRYDSGRGFYIV